MEEKEDKQSQIFQCQGWIRVRVSIAWCWRGSLACLRPTTGCCGRITDLLFKLLMRLTFLNASPPKAFKLEPPNSAQLFRRIWFSVPYLFRLIGHIVFIKRKIKNHKSPIDLHCRNVQLSQDYSNSNCQNSNLKIQKMRLNQAYLLCTISNPFKLIQTHLSNISNLYILATC